MHFSQKLKSSSKKHPCSCDKHWLTRGCQNCAGQRGSKTRAVLSRPQTPTKRDSRPSDVSKGAHLPYEELLQLHPSPVYQGCLSVCLGSIRWRLPNLHVLLWLFPESRFCVSNSLLYIFPRTSQELLHIKKMKFSLCYISSLSECMAIHQVTASFSTYPILSFKSVTKSCQFGLQNFSQTCLPLHYCDHHPSPDLLHLSSTFDDHTSFLIGFSVSILFPPPVHLSKSWLVLYQYILSC